ncbi:Hypothetical protein NocV09_02300250 [Nannochloropsis oceanica]
MNKQATRRGLALLVPVTMAGQAGRQPQPAQSRADPQQHSAGNSTVVLNGSSGSSSNDRNSNNNATVLTATTKSSTIQACVDSPSSLVPREMPDAVTRVVCASFRYQQQPNQRQQQSSHHIDENNAFQSSATSTHNNNNNVRQHEGMISNAASQPEVQTNVNHRLAQDPDYHRFFSSASGDNTAFLHQEHQQHHHHYSAFSSPNVSPLSHRAKCYLPPSSSSPPPLPSTLFHAIPHNADRCRKNFAAAVNCSVCLLPLTDAHVVDCGEGHVFCRACVWKVQGREGGREGGGEGWSLASWLSAFFLGSVRVVGGRGRTRTRRRSGSLCPECRCPFSTSIPVRRINDIVESVRRLLPSQFEDEDFQEQEERNRHAEREGGAEGAEDALPPGGREESIPAWFFTFVCFVVVVAFAIKK